MGQISGRINNNFKIDGAFEFVNHKFTRNGKLWESNDFERVELTNDFPPKVTDSKTMLDRYLEENTTSNNIAASIGLHLLYGDVQFFPGLRFEYFSQGGYKKILPRINMIYSFSQNLIMTAGFGRFAQYFHAVGIESFQLPVENWVWSNDSIRPSYATTSTVGLQLKTSVSGNFIVESYYRKFENLLNFDPVETFKAISGTGTLIPVYTQVTTTGIGEAYGIEFQHNIQLFKFNLRTAYTLSKSDVKFENINEDQWYPSKTDSRHDLTVNVEWNPMERWSFGGNFNYRTGTPVTMAYSAYDREEDPPGNRYSTSRRTIYLEKQE